MRSLLTTSLLFIVCACATVYAHTISINDITVTEKDSGIVSATFTLQLSAPSPGGDDSVTVFTSTTGSTATLNEDYEGLLQNVVIPEGDLTQTVTINVLSDDVPELSEFFFVKLTNATPTIDDGEGRCTIIDDDGDAPGLFIGSIIFTEGDSGTLDAVLNVTLSASPGVDVTVNYDTADGSATSTDYTATSNVLTIPNGQFSGTITVPVVGDADPETNEYFFVNLSNATNAIVVEGQGTIIVKDNDGSSLFLALFEDGILDSNWTFGSGWSENAGALVGTATKKTSAIATPIFLGCSQCSFTATVRTAGGSGKVSAFGWYFDKRNTLEIMMKEGSDKWIIKLKQDAEVIVKEKLLLPILPNVDYQWFVFYDGSRFLFFLDGVLVKTIILTFTPQGTFGFQVKGATGTFGELVVN